MKPITLYEKEKIALENLRTEKLQGHFIRSRDKWVDEGEKPKILRFSELSQ